MHGLALSQNTKKDNTQRALSYRRTLNGGAFLGGAGKALPIASGDIMLPSHKIKIAIFDSYILWLAAYNACGAFFKCAVCHTAT